MALHLYNTLTRTVEPFEPLDRKTVTMYVCGPTVYDDPHIGHARSAYVFDVLRRYLEFKGFPVRFVRNVTDVDDKIIEKARQEAAHSRQQTADSDLKGTCREVAEKYLTRYHEVMQQLGIKPPDLEPKATDHVVPEMTDFIAKLLIQGVAYEAGGDVYFAVRKHPAYGKLSNRTLDELQAGARVEPGEHKNDPLDFALWKAAKPGEPSWKSPWGEGRPGWHIECSAMSTRYLGDQFDIHGGGIDLVFPHHENEIAQAQAAGKPFARFWIHNGLLTVNGEKMSKSLGNFITVDQALQQTGNADALKVFFLGTHYRKPIDYSEANIEAAEKRFSGLWHFLGHAEAFGWTLTTSEAVPEEVSRLRDEFVQMMDDDLNTSAALAVLDKLADLGYQWVELWRKRRSQWEKAHPGELQVSGEDPETEMLRSKFAASASKIQELGKVLGLSFRMAEESAEANALFNQYKAARARKDFQTSDQKRKALEKQGFVIQDTTLTDSIMLPKR